MKQTQINKHNVAWFKLAKETGKYSKILFYKKNKNNLIHLMNILTLN